MKRNLLFEKCLSNVDPEIRNEVRSNMEKVDKIYAKHLEEEACIDNGSK